MTLPAAPAALITVISAVRTLTVLPKDILEPFIAIKRRFLGSEFAVLVLQQGVLLAVARILNVCNVLQTAAALVRLLIV